MKRTLLLLLSMLFLVSNTEAKNSELSGMDHNRPVYFNPKPIQFSEAGILFRVYPNGQLSYAKDHKIRKQYVNKQNRRYVLRKAPKKFRFISPKHQQKIKIGRTIIRFNAFGKVRRIGSVDIGYRHRKLAKVGQLRLAYNRYGNVRYFGKVKPQRRIVYR